MKYLLIIGIISMLVLAACTTETTTTTTGPDADASGGTPTTAQGPIKLGLISPLTGDVSVIGLGIKNGAQLAVGEENAKGGQQFDLIAEDGKCNGKDANNAANKLVNIDMVSAIIGGACSGETLSFTDVVEQAHVPTVSPGSTAPSISDAGDYVFRIVASDSYQAKVAANLAMDTFNAKTAAVLYSTDEYASGLANAFKDTFTSSGGDVVAFEAFEKSSNDFRTQLTKLQQAKPDIVYIPGYYPDVGRVLQQARELGIDVQFIGADGSKDDTLMQVGGDATEDFIVTYPSSKTTPEFDSAYKEAYGVTPPLYAQQGYDTAKILMQVIEEQGTNAEAVKDALYNVDYNGVSGHITFDSNGDLANPAYDIVVVKDGAFVPFNVTE
ncbi:MAG: ABC transporter substrate-binding protein [Candidatus Woesearchaeota archaeon]